MFNSTEHKKYINLACKLAKKGYGNVSPNPMVGAVVVKHKKVLATGFHKAFGENHAERDALLKLNKNETQGADLYVNLLPCCHIGKTPACTEIIKEYQISRVFYSSFDPNPLVAQKSLDFFKNANIKTIYVNSKKSHYLNRKFLYSIKNRIPYITLKIASTIDGKAALNSGLSKAMITNVEARKNLHKVRAGYDAILIGANTLNIDNPNLGTYLSDFKNDPFRILLSKKDMFEFDNRLDFFRDDRYKIVKDYNDLVNFCNTNHISSVLVEGGPETLSYFYKNGYFNELLAYYGDFALGNAGIPILTDVNVKDFSNVNHLKLISVKKISNNFKVVYLNESHEL